MHHAAQGPRGLWLGLLVLVLLPLALGARRRVPSERVAQLVAVGALVAAAAVHGLAAAEHGGWQGAAFVLCLAAQALLAWALLTRPGERVVVAAGLVSAGAVLVWLETRTIGLDLGIERVGLLDGGCVALELLTLGCCGLLRRRLPSGLPLDRESAGWALIVSAVALAALA